MTTILPAVVTIIDLPVATTVSSATLFEALLTSGGALKSVQVSLGQIATTSFGGLPTAGNTGQLLGKASATDYASQWVNISSQVAGGTSITVGGSTSIVVGVTNFGIGSSQIATFAVGSQQLATFAVQGLNIATNAVGNIQLRQGSALSVIGVAGNAVANVADIQASGGTQVLQSNAAGNTVLFGPLTTAFMPIQLQLANITAEGVIYGNGSALPLAATNFGTTGMFLQGNGSALPPGFALVNLGSATNIVGTTAMINGGTGTNTLATPWGVVLGGTTALGVTAAGTAGFVLTGTGTTSAPTFQNITTLAVTQFTVAGGLTVAQGASGGAITGTGTVYAQHTPFYKTSAYTVAATDLGATIIFTSGSLTTAALGTVTATGLGSGFFVDLYNAAATSIVIAPLGAAVITGIAATAIMPPGTGMRVVSDATNWVPQFAAGAYALHLTKANQTFAGGMRLVSFNAGTTSGGTSITFDSGNGPIQHIRNAGTGTLTAPSSDGEIDVLIMGTTNASTLTFSGFNASTSAPVGDTYVANATSLFLFSIRRVNGSSTYRLAAYQ